MAVMPVRLDRRSLACAEQLAVRDTLHCRNTPDGKESSKKANDNQRCTFLFSNVAFDVPACDFSFHHFALCAIISFDPLIRLSACPRTHICTHADTHSRRPLRLFLTHISMLLLWAIVKQALSGVCDCNVSQTLIDINSFGFDIDVLFVPILNWCFSVKKLFVAS